MITEDEDEDADEDEDGTWGLDAVDLTEVEAMLTRFTMWSEVFFQVKNTKPQGSISIQKIIDTKL